MKTLNRLGLVAALLAVGGACQCIDLTQLAVVQCEADQTCSGGKVCCPDNTCRVTCIGGQGGGEGGGIGGGGGSGGGGGPGGGGGSGGGGGGSGGSGGGGAISVCDNATCGGGCCNGSGQCQSPPLFTFCGTDGGSCTSCPPGLSDNCDTGACGCGDAGVCASGQLCEQGRCICNNLSCPTGCCSSGSCVPFASQSSGLCGTNGASCGACPGGRSDRCETGVCQCGGNVACNAGSVCLDAGIGISCVCTPASCDGGCCLGNACSSIAPSDAGTADPVLCRNDAGTCQQCVPGSSDRCDVAGSCRCGPTVPCGAGLRCLNGGCVCDAASCPAGCCAFGVCRPVDDFHCRTNGTMSCNVCSGETDNCAAGAFGCRCGTQVCGATQRCENGRCTCRPELCGPTGGCCDPLSGNCQPPAAGTCGQAGTCGNCDGGSCASGLCSSCQASCSTCCLGDQCVGPTTPGVDKFFCALPAAGVNAVCTQCDAVTADQCNGSGCSCGGGPRCKEGDECFNGGCRCSVTTCTGCCEVLGASFSQCIGTRSAYYCAPNDGGAQTCQDCNPTAAIRSDRCSPQGTCACGTNGPCPVGMRCLDGVCHPP